MFEELLKRLAVALDAARLPYMVFGGQAVLLYGEPRLTRDIDITLGVDTSQAASVLRMIEKLGLRILVDNVDQFLSQTFVLPGLGPGIQRPHRLRVLVDGVRAASHRARQACADSAASRCVSFRPRI